MKRPLLPALAAAILLAFVPFRGFFGPGVPMARDLPFYFYPLKAHLGAALRAGEMPWLDVYRWGGSPLLGAPGAAPFDPGNLLFVLFDVGTAAKAWMLLRLACGVAGFALFARRRGLTAPGAALAGLLFGLSGTFVSFLPFLGAFAAFSLLPWFALALERALERPVRARVAALAVASALLVVCAAPEFGLYAALVALALLAPGLRRAQASRQLAALAGAALLAAGLAAPALLTAARAAARSTRGPGGGMNLAAAGSGSLHSARVPELAVDFALADWRSVAGLPERGISYPYLPSITPGRVALLLAALGLFAGRRAIAPAALAAFGVLLALGPATPVWTAAAHALPLVSSVRYPEKHLALWGFGAAWLAALGIGRLETLLRPRLRAAALALLALAVLADREAVARGLLPLEEGGALSRRPPLLAALPSSEPPPRLFAVESYRALPWLGGDLRAQVRLERDVQMPEWPTLFGVATLFSPDYDLLLPRESFEWTSLLRSAVPTGSPVVGALLRTTGVAAVSELDRESGRPRLRVLSAPLAPYRFARRVVADPDGRRLFARALREAFEPGTAYLARPRVPLPDALSPGRVLSVADRAGGLTLEVSGSGPFPSFLMLYRGLDALEEATLDGRSLDVADVLLGFGGVVVPPGRHLLRLRPETGSVRIGALMSAASLLVLGVLFRRGARSSGTGCP